MRVTVLLVRALANRSTARAVAELALTDADPVRLRTLGGLARAWAREIDAPFHVTLSDDRDAALEDADFVVTSIRAGGDSARARYERIALDHGVIGQETVGAGGFALALWNGPALLEIATAVAQRAPRAWTLHFTNPAGLVAQILHDAGFSRHIGICDTPTDLIRRVSVFAGVGAADADASVIGLNHLSWLTHLGIGDPARDLLPELLADPRFLAAVAPPFEPTLVRSLGVLPTEYLHYYYHRDAALARQQQRHGTRGAYLDARSQALRDELDRLDPRGRFDSTFLEAAAAYARYTADRDGSYRDELGRDDAPPASSDQGEGYAGVALDLIEALCGAGERRAIASLPSGGSVPGLDDDDVVETRIIVSTAGLVPAPLGRLPRDAHGLMCAVKSFERLASRAVRERDSALAARALTAHPLVGSYRIGSRLVGAFLDSHRDPRGAWR